MKINYRQHPFFFLIIIIIVILVLLLIYTSYRNCKYPQVENFTNKTNTNQTNNKKPKSFISASLSNKLDETIDKNASKLQNLIVELKTKQEILQNNPDKVPCYLQKELFDKCTGNNNDLSDDELLEKYNLDIIEDETIKTKTIKRIRDQEAEYKKKLDELCKKEKESCIDIPQEIQFMEIEQITKYIKKLEKLQQKTDYNKIYYKTQKKCEECKRTNSKTEECIKSCKEVDDHSLETGLYRDENQSTFFKKKLLAMELHEGKLDKDNVFSTNKEIDYIFEILKREIITPKYYYYQDKSFTFKYNSIENLKINNYKYKRSLLTTNPAKTYFNFILAKKDTLSQTLFSTDETLEFILFSREIDFTNQDEKTTILTYIKDFLTYRKVINSNSNPEIINDTLKINVKLNKYDNPKEVLITIVKDNLDNTNYEYAETSEKTHTNMEGKMTDENLSILEEKSLDRPLTTMPSVEKQQIFDIPNLPEFYNVLDKVNSIDYYNFAQQNSNYHNQNLNHNQQIYKTHYQPFSFDNNKSSLS